MKPLCPPGWPRPKGYANAMAARGRTIFTAIEGQSTPGGVGPYFAF